MNDNELFEFLKRINAHIDNDNTSHSGIVTELAELRKDIEFITKNLGDGKVEFAKINAHFECTDGRIDRIENKLSFWRGGGAMLSLIMGLVAVLSAFATWAVDHYMKLLYGKI